MGVGLTVLYLTLVPAPHPLGLHGAVWSILANFLVTIVVSRVTSPPSSETVARIHGEVERFVYGDEE
jgi:Na+(H+)/acetate symporter ActP